MGRPDPEHPNLGQTNWTQEQVDHLDTSLDAHLDNCAECDKSYIAEGCLTHETDEECLADAECNDCRFNPYCPVGQKALDDWADAQIEFSWQEDFPNAIQV